MTRNGVLHESVDFYVVLGVSPTAPVEEIRACFKRLVLESHPDKNPGRREWSERRVRELIEAYEVIGNAENRAAFDRSRRAAQSASASSPLQRKEEPFFFRKKDPEARALLVLYLLLNHNAGAAFELLEEMEMRFGKGFLRTHLEREDYLDCLFLLGEYHLSQKDYTRAADRLSTFFRHEEKARFPRHYLNQVVELLKDLWLRKIPRTADTDTALDGLEAAIELGLTRAEEALRLRKTAEILIAAGSSNEARAVLDEAAAKFPASKDFEKVRRKLDTVGAAKR